ncbi:MAG: response regulator [Burkholderiales bacterium]
MNSPIDEVRIVVVDDMPDAAQSLAELLRMTGYMVRTCYDGAQALEVIRSFEPHCVLFDVLMPGIDGSQLAATLRSDYGDDIVLIAVTGGDEEQAPVKSTFLQVDHYLRKPLDIPSLHRLLPPLH